MTVVERIRACFVAAILSSESKDQNHVFRVRPNRDILSSDFLAAVSSSPYGKAFFVRSSKQSTNLASINSTQLKAFPIPLPSYEEQAKLDELLKTQNDCHAECIQEAAKLRSIKAALMQDLLTGKRRVTPLLELEPTQMSEIQWP